ncbi:methyl-accepting chemotaxis protein [Desulforamulus aeronauticus DSM 10349]|uniref:Methyl-accepting chemotaxis protein n=1 Tax=Desulforamulus aeronauticus DSM 10349 TaxID=1121421 RepID=A0A1M6S2A0_9FIRM|nr:HAMP domain-containing methyl-accepting chemotaxis protein [Desulforamulus aeronauticus]SHK38840.1 methyl-accepting chemotaxis protein [Desulforamulus aeronauticus DSM 10349]
MNFTVRVKLLLGFGLLLAMLVGLGIFSTYALKNLNDITDEIAEGWLPGVQQIEMTSNLVAVHRVKEFRHLVATDPGELALMEDEMATAKKEIETTLVLYEKTISSDYERNIFNKVKTSLGTYYELNQKIIQLCKESKNAEAMSIMQNDSLQSFNTLNTDLTELVKYNQDNGLKAAQTAEQIYTASKATLSLLIMMAFLIGAVTALLLSRNIRISLKQIESAANQLAVGDITGADIVIKNKDEIGNLAIAFNKMKNNLKDVLVQVTTSAKEVSDTATGLTSQAEQTSAAATENAATVEEIASTVDQVANNASNVAEAAQRISSSASTGVTSIEQVNEQINTISNSSEKANLVMQELSNTLHKVNQIVDVITGIADQTNLLALNAAIEAARAGEQGRGFAVVAEEVRKLAEQSSVAAKEIYSLINNVQSESRVAVEAMEKGNLEVKKGVRVATEAGEILQAILGEISDLSFKIEDVAAAAEQVAAGVQNVASSTEEQTAAMEEVSAVTADLKRIAINMNDLVDKFKI